MSGARSHPLFHGASREIARRIELGELTPGDRLPSERWFGDTLGVSRTTVRRAIEELLVKGLVEMRAGALYVAVGEGGAMGNSLMSLTELARSRGLTPTARVLLSTVRPATLDEAEDLRIAPGADLFELRRLRLLDGASVAVDHNRVPLRYLPAAPSIDFTTASLYGSLTEAGHQPVKARLQIGARNATDDEVELLGLTEVAPVLVATEQTIDATGRTVAKARTVYRSDRHRFLATFTRTGAAGAVAPSP
jgi:GntR family transcriptional regulator